MGNLVIKEPPEFQDKIHKIEEEEYLTAELENGIKGALLNNDVYLKRKLEEIIENIESGGVGVTFPLEVPNSKEIKFIGVEDADNGNKLVSHILYKNKNDLVLKLIDEKQHSEKELINITENDYGTDEIEINGNLSTYYVYTEGIELGYIGSEKAMVLTSSEAGNKAKLYLGRKNENGYEELLEIDGDGIANFSHSVNILAGNLGLDSSNAQRVRFKNYTISQNGTDTQFWLFYNNTDPIFNYNSNLGYSKWYKKIVLDKGVEIKSNDPDYAALIEVNDCDFMLKGSAQGSSFSPFMSADLDSNEVSFYSDVMIPTGSSLYIGVQNIYSVDYKNAFDKRFVGFGMNSLYLSSFVIGETSLLNGHGIYFSDPKFRSVDHYHMYQYQDNNNNQFLKIDLSYKDLASNINIMTLSRSEVRFYTNVYASNITRMASDIVTAQQEITEQDLQLIETQQLLTEQELENIETQQLLTEMDLEKIEGGQAL